MTTITSPARTGWPSVARTAITRPGIGAVRTDAPSTPAAAWATADSTVGGWATLNSTLWPSTSTWIDRSVADGGDRWHRAHDRDGPLLVAVAHASDGRAVQPPSVGPRIGRALRREAGGGLPLLGARDRWTGQLEAGDRVGPHVAVAHLGPREQPSQESQVRPHSQNRRLVERGTQPVKGGISRWAVGDDLRQHRVVSVTDDVALRHAGVDPDSGGPANEREATGRGKEAGLGVLGVEPRLDRVAVRRRRDLETEVGQGRARRDRELVGHEVAPGDGLGHRVLDLETRVHLEEEELSRVGQEHLDRPGIDVARGRGHRQRRIAHPGAELRRDRWCRRLLDDLLVASLRRAVALAEVDSSTSCVEEHLDLDVTRALEIALEDEPVVAEGPMRLASGAPPATRVSSPGPRTTRMPLPPPPALGLTSRG